MLAGTAKVTNVNVRSLKLTGEDASKLLFQMALFSHIGDNRDVLVLNDSGRISNASQPAQYYLCRLESPFLARSVDPSL